MWDQNVTHFIATIHAGKASLMGVQTFCSVTAVATLTALKFLREQEANVVVRLSQTIPNCILVYLRSRVIYSLGTIHSARISNYKLPIDTDKQLAKEDKGFSVEYVGNTYGVDLATVLWKDNKNVRLASTHVDVLPFKSAIQKKQLSKASRFDRSTKSAWKLTAPSSYVNIIIA